MSDPADRYMTIAELIGYSRLSRDLLERAMRDARDPLPSHQVGRRVLVKLSAFDQWMVRRQRTGTPELARRPTARLLSRLDEPPKKRLPRAQMKSNSAAEAGA